MRKVVIIGMVDHGFTRIIPLSKYLSKYGWEPIIISSPIKRDYGEIKCPIIITKYSGDISKKLYNFIGLSSEQTLEEQIQISRKKSSGELSFIYRMLYWFISWLTFPDNQRLWFKHALKAADQYFQSNKVDAIISTSSPITAHLIAYSLKKKYNIPWIADQRDLWCLNHVNKKIFGIIRLYLDYLLEKKIMKKTNAITTVSEPLSGQLKKLHSNKKVFAITNGFEFDEIQYPERVVTEKITLIYTGQIYDNQDPEPLLIALSEFFNEHNNINIEVNFYGPHYIWLDNFIEKYNLKNNVIQKGKIPRDKALEIQKKATILLFFDWNDQEQKGIYSLKIFEYLAAKRPILAIGNVRGSVVEELLLETQAGIFFSKPDEIRQQLNIWHLEYLETGTLKYYGINEKIQQYSHLEIARKFALILDDLY